MAQSHSRIKNPKMDQDFFTSLPTEIMSDIVLRLPSPSILSCKFVCKSCRDLINSREFVESHSSRLCLALFQDDARISKPFNIIEFVYSQNSEQNLSNVALNFSFPHQTMLHSSANGLLLLINTETCPQNLLICNPIIYEYIKLPFPIENCAISSFDVLGFGVSKFTGDYKVVRFFYDRVISQRKCEVYSLRRGLWRSVETAGDQLQYARMSLPVSSNGNLHWLVCLRGEAQFRGILCFDLETECFSTFSIPFLVKGSMCALGDSLCLCDYNSLEGFVIWLMNEYGDDQSWAKEFVINIQTPYDLSGDVAPIKVSKDGAVLFVRRQCSSVLYYYSSKTETIQEIDGAAEWFVNDGTMCIYTPSFLSLKTLTKENNVISY